MAAFATASSYGRIYGANNRIRGAFIGAGGRGQFNLKEFLKNRDTDVAAVCDIYDANFAAAQALAPRAFATGDFRRVLERSDVDFVCISTPDHWHALMTLAAYEAGKDVYGEKPIVYCSGELNALYAAQRKYPQRIFQSGQVRRSAKHFKWTADYIRSGALGSVQAVRTWFFGRYKPMDPHPDGPVPAGVDWDMYLGPAPYRAYNPNRHLFNFRWFWDYAAGIFTDWGAHLVDLAVRPLVSADGGWMGKGPRFVETSGGMGCATDGRETPLLFKTTFAFDGFEFIFEHDWCTDADPPYYSEPWGILWYGKNGTLFVGRKHAKLFDVKGRLAKTIGGENGDAKHWREFVECVRSRKQPSACLANIGESNRFANLAAVAYRAFKEQRIQDPSRTSFRMAWDAKTQSSPTNEAQQFLMRPYRGEWQKMWEALAT